MAILLHKVTENCNHKLKIPQQQRRRFLQCIFPFPCPKLRHVPQLGDQESSFCLYPSSISQWKLWKGGFRHTRMHHWLSPSGFSRCTHKTFCDSTGQPFQLVDPCSDHGQLELRHLCEQEYSCITNTNKFCFQDVIFDFLNLLDSVFLAEILREG